MSISNIRFNSADVINLNVGGEIFSATVETLTKTDNFFKKLFSDLEKGEAISRDKEGHIFIDRPHKPFKILLNYLQTGTLDKRNSKIEEEAKFYKIQLPASEPLKEDLLKEIIKVQETLRENKEVATWSIAVPHSLCTKDIIEDFLYFANSFSFQQEGMRVGDAHFQDGKIFMTRKWRED